MFVCLLEHSKKYLSINYRNILIECQKTDFSKIQTARCFEMVSPKFNPRFTHCFNK